jgi:hypothetical protein
MSEFQKNLKICCSEFVLKADTSSSFTITKSILRV